MKIILGLAMLLLAFEPAFSKKNILEKLDKQLKKMGLQKLQNLFADVGENAVEIGNNALDIQTLETMGSGSVWFDAFSTTTIENGNGNGVGNAWKVINYTNVRESNSNSGAINLQTGMFTAPLAGTYQFIIQACQDPGRVAGDVKIVLEGSTISSVGADDDDYFDYDECQSTMTGTAITQMQPGQKVWAETLYRLYSNSAGYIHFTGVFLTPE